jgi:hypothetical protein
MKNNARDSPWTSSDHCWHSAQFRFSYAEQKAYWVELLGENGFQIGE